MFVNKIETASELHNEFEAYGRGAYYTEEWLYYRKEHDKEMTDERLQSLVDDDVEEKILKELNDDYCCRELSNGGVLIC